MGTSQRAFDQVKSILGKLDRDIDAARARRLHDHTPHAPGAASAAGPASAHSPSPNPGATQAPAPSTQAPSSPSPSPAPTLTPTLNPTPAMPHHTGAGKPGVAPAANPPRSPFGRATPMRISRPSGMTGT